MIGTAPGSQSTHDRSSIAFPYVDLNSAIELAEVIAQNYALQADAADIASHLGHDGPSGGAFRNKLAAARIYGLIETTNRGNTATLTALGRDITDSQTARGARVQAFLNVPLFKAVFEGWRGRTLPRDRALEMALLRLGVAPKQAPRARQVLSRSAEQAGFFTLGPDRLVMPAGIVPPQNSESSPSPANGSSVDSPDAPEDLPRGRPVGGVLDLDPAIAGVLAYLPRPGAEWPKAARERWLAGFSAILAIVYPEPL